MLIWIILIPQQNAWKHFLFSYFPQNPQLKTIFFLMKQSIDKHNIQINQQDVIGIGEEGKLNVK